MKDYVLKVVNMFPIYIESIGLKLLFSVIVLVVGLKLIDFFIKFISKLRGFKNIDPTAQSFIKSFSAVSLKVVLLTTVVSILGVPLTSVVALLASAGLAIGLALQGALSNFAGGLIILIFKPFKLGDHIETQSLSGIVQDITVFYTILVTPDGKRITLPNGTMTNASIINLSSEETRRIDLAFKAPNDLDVELVKRMLLDIAQKHPLVLKKPEPVSRLNSSESGTLNYIFRVWCKNTDYWAVRYDLTEWIKAEFDKKGIGIF